MRAIIKRESDGTTELTLQLGDKTCAFPIQPATKVAMKNGAADQKIELTVTLEVDLIATQSSQLELEGV